MELDVIIPTYNRQELLQRTLESLLVADVPEGLSVRVTVVDNNSKDETPRVVEDWKERFGGRLSYVFEGKQGRSHALNAGIANTTGELVGMIDDDEEVDRTWYRRVYRAFTEEKIDFIGGPYVPRWGTELPRWLPEDHRGVIGWIDGGDKVAVFGEDYKGMLMGGNAVLTRSVLEKAGPYPASLGRTAQRLLSGEDQYMFQRLMDAGARGLYLPDLIIYHYIPAERLTKRYFRRWCFWNGVSLGLIDRDTRSPVTYLCGVPRYFYGRIARGMLKVTRKTLREGRDPAQIFSEELRVWDLVGFFYGKHFYRPAQQ